MLQANGDINLISNFWYGSDKLNIDLLGIAQSALNISDAVVEDVHDIAFSSNYDPHHGVVLLGVTGNASDLIAHHLSISNR